MNFNQLYCQVEHLNIFIAKCEKRKKNFNLWREGGGNPKLFDDVFNL